MKEKITDWIASYCHWLFAFLSIITVYLAFFENPKGADTGLYAATLGMYAACLTLANRVRRKRWSPVFVGFALVFVGYLFAASESDVHPTDLTLWGGLAVILVFASAMVLAVMAFFAMLSASQPRQPTFITREEIIAFLGAGLPMETTFEWLSQQKGGYAESDHIFVVPVPEGTAAKAKASHVRYAQDAVRENTWRIESFFLVQE